MKKIICLIFTVFFIGNIYACKKLSQGRIDLVRNYIESKSFVRDTAVFQEGCKLSLAIIMDYAVNKEYAKEIGETFLRQIKSHAPGETPPGKQIGKGIFEYLVGAYFPNEKNDCHGS